MQNIQNLEDEEQRVIEPLTKKGSQYIEPLSSQRSYNEEYPVLNKKGSLYFEEECDEKDHGKPIG